MSFFSFDVSTTNCLTAVVGIVVVVVAAAIVADEVPVTVPTLSSTGFFLPSLDSSSCARPPLDGDDNKTPPAFFFGPRLCCELLIDAVISNSSKSSLSPSKYSTRYRHRGQLIVLRGGGI